MPYKFNPFIGNFDEVQDIDGKVDGPASSTDNAVARYDGTTGKIIQNSGVTIDDSDNVTIPGDLTVNGTTTTINTATLDVTDQNITVNVGGNDASAEGAGLTVERTGTDGSFVYEDALTTKWKLGALGSEIEIADISSTQTLTNKTIDADNNTILDIANANIAVAAAIEVTKLEALTANRATITDASGFLTVSPITNTELGFLTGVTSNVQTQLDAKVDEVASTDNALTRFDGTGGSIQNSAVLLSDTDQLSGLAGLQFTAGVQVISVLDEDDLVSDSATALATQQSIKAYVDDEIAALPTPVDPFTVVSISANTSATSGTTYLVDSTAGQVTVTLPAPALNAFVRVKDAVGNANTSGENIRVAPNAAETIDGAATFQTLDSNFESATFISDGTNWFIL